MYDTILIPVDLSSANEAVFSTARDLGTPDQTTIILLHVIETLQDDDPGEMDDFYEELREEADKKMKAWAGQIAEDGYDVQAAITYGERAPEITRAAGEHKADLIVQRSHKVDPEEENPNVGSVSHQVAIFAPCSVFLVRVSRQS
jgi:nucleotide-binding universal stress UspA family protein